MPPAEGSSTETKPAKSKRAVKVPGKEAKPKAAATAEAKPAAAKKSPKGTKKASKSGGPPREAKGASGGRKAKTAAEKAAEKAAAAAAPDKAPAAKANGPAAEEKPAATAATTEAAATPPAGDGSAAQPGQGGKQAKRRGSSRDVPAVDGDGAAAASTGRQGSSRGLMGGRQKPGPATAAAGRGRLQRNLLPSKKIQVDVDKIIRAEDREIASAATSHNDKAIEVKLDPRGQTGITFHGIHVAGIDAIRAREVNKDVHGEKVKVEDELYAIDGEQLHGGLTHPQVTQLLEAKMMAKRASGFAVRLSLRRRHGHSHVSGDLGDFMHHLGKEYASGQPDVRPFVYSIDQGLLGMTKAHLEASRIEYTDELALLKHKADAMTAEDEGRPAIATDLMRLTRKAAFMTRMVELQKRRRQIQAVISAFMQEPLHGPQRQRERLAKQSELVEIENEMKVLCEARVSQLTAYSSYDCRSRLIKLNAQKAQLVNEKAVLEKSLNRKHTLEDRDSVRKDIAQLEQLEAHAMRTMREFKDNIYVKEIELDGILADFEQEHFGLQVEDGGAEFPSKSTFWNGNKRAKA